MSRTSFKMQTRHPMPMPGRITPLAIAKLHPTQTRGDEYSIPRMKMVNCNGTLSTQEQESIFFSYFVPYSYERHLQLIATCTAMKAAKVTSLGQSLDGRELECITVGTGSRTCWVIHRQHPGESMADPTMPKDYWNDYWVSQPTVPSMA